MDAFVQKMISVRPSRRQLLWQEMEFYAFVHYGVNQFTNREWGTGQEDPSIFDPKSLDTDQWCRAFRAAGMKGVLITAKHHDGFCLWDTAYTTHSVMHSPYGKDIVAQLSASCKRYGLKLGVYLSPWDRHEACYGQGKPYDDFFCNQLTELLTKYGDLFCVWFDGACGEGPNGKKQVYDWVRYYSLIRTLQPDAAICVCGPDVRWCGNEAGHCRKEEWSVVPLRMANNESIQMASQQVDDGTFREKIPTNQEDLGSRAVIKDEVLAWFPAEVNTSIRPGWFYHESEDDRVRSLADLSNVYVQSVGGNANFILNVPPHPQGYIAEPDVNRLAELGQWISESFGTDLLAGAKLTASASEEGHGADRIGVPGECWKAPDECSLQEITAETAAPIAPKYLVLEEDIRFSQRIEAFELSCLAGGEWTPVVQGTTVGNRRILKLPEDCSSACWKVRITECRAGATLRAFKLC